MRDKVGKQTLDTISEADKFNQWMFETIKPFAKGKVLEVGSGIGNISELFLDNGFSIMLSDFRPEYCSELRNKFSVKPNFLGVQNIDLVHPDFSRNYKNLLNSFDTVFALNVVEHIENDKKAILNCRQLLKEDGHLIILVPSYQNLYNSFDKELGHFRRYKVSQLKSIFDQSKFEIIHSQYFNLMGTLGWYVNGSILKKRTIPANQMKMYNKLVPIFKILDKVTLQRAGLSTIVIGSKLKDND
jgi:2-polyprenyl-3-methyl-5-hydroxy-6-metoxy-1,4-benzoquinol methylase